MYKMMNTYVILHVVIVCLGPGKALGHLKDIVDDMKKHPSKLVPTGAFRCGIASICEGAIQYCDTKGPYPTCVDCADIHWDCFTSIHQYNCSLYCIDQLEQNQHALCPACTDVSVEQPWHYTPTVIVWLSGSFNVIFLGLLVFLCLRIKNIKIFCNCEDVRTRFKKKIDYLLTFGGRIVRIDYREEETMTTNASSESGPEQGPIVDETTLIMEVEHVRAEHGSRLTLVPPP